MCDKKFYHVNCRFWRVHCGSLHAPQEAINIAGAQRMPINRQGYDQLNLLLQFLPMLIYVSCADRYCIFMMHYGLITKQREK